VRIEVPPVDSSKALAHRFFRSCPSSLSKISVAMTEFTKIWRNLSSSDSELYMHLRRLSNPGSINVFHAKSIEFCSAVLLCL
jgi:hypothetical protein